MKKTKITTLGIATTAIVAAPLAFVVSCGEQSFESRNYDFGVAIAPTNTLNYVKSKGSLFKILPSLVSGLLVDAPSADLVKQLQIPIYKGTMTLGSISIPWIISDYHLLPGVTDDKNDSVTLELDQDINAKSMSFKINKEQKWKGAKDSKYNRQVLAQDFVDYLTLVGDINTGSDYLDSLLNIGINGLQDIVDAQNDYALKFGATYKNPFGNGVKFAADGTVSNLDAAFPSQNAGDDTFVDAIKTAAKDFLENGASVTSTGEFKIGFKPGTDIGVITKVARSVLPVNKEFVDHVGGVEKFGRSVDSFIYTSAFDITDIRLGQGGYMMLEKDPNYHSAKYTVSNKIKVYFQDDPNILSAMFSDKYISSTPISSTYRTKLWAKENDRQFIKKNNGIGTLSVQLNLEKNSNSPLLDENLRNAIAHAINRQDLLKLLNWDATFPVSTWTPKSEVKTSNGLSYDAFADLETYKDKYAPKPIPITTSPFLEHGATQFTYEAAGRKDNRFSVDMARKYFADWKSTTGKNSVTLKFLASDKSSLDAGLGLQTMFDEAFGGAIKLDIRQVPANSYETYRKSGDFDITTYNFDAYGFDIESYVKRLFFVDEIDKAHNKDTGLKENPTGSWTFNSWYKANAAKIDDIKTNQFMITNSDDEKIWNKVIEVMKIEPKELGHTNKALKDKLTSFWTKTDAVINTDLKVFKLVTMFEKIIAISSPVIPILEVDTNWTASRLGGVQNTYTFALQYAYDVLNKPTPNLPGKESL